MIVYDKINHGKFLNWIISFWDMREQRNQNFLIYLYFQSSE